MKTLIVEDDFTCRLLLQELLKSYGDSHIAVNGKEAVEAVRISMETCEPYNLICLDVMMPVMDGQQALKEIRSLEETEGTLSSNRAKIMMTTALGDLNNVMSAYNSLCDAYLTKPIDKTALIKKLREMKLIP